MYLAGVHTVLLIAHSPPSVLTGAGPPCCTCVMMLAAPPAAAMAYVNPSRGLEPSVYGGGGSVSSAPFVEDSPLVSCGSAAFTSASAADGPSGGSGGTGCAIAGGAEGSGSVTRTFEVSEA